MTETEEGISDLEDRMVEIIATEQNIGKRMGKKKKDNLRDLCERVSCSVIFDSAILWTVAFQAPLSMGFSRQEYCSVLPFHSPGDLSNPGIELEYKGHTYFNYYKT